MKSSSKYNVERTNRLRVIRALAALCIICAALVFLRTPGCTPEKMKIGGQAETEMSDGKLTPVTLKFIDDGKPSPVRVYFKYRGNPYVIGPEVGYYFPVYWDRFYQDKYFPLRPEIPVLDMEFGMEHHYYFLTGEATVKLVPGPYEVIAYKGLEYRPVHFTFEAGDEESSHEISLDRWTDMQSKGWYGGDEHIHLARYGHENSVYLAMQEADGVHVGHYLQLQRLWQGAVQKTWGKPGEARKGNSILRSGEEPRSWFGHTLLLGIDRLILPVGQGDIDTESDLVQKLTADYFAEAHSAGGMIGYAHGDGLNKYSAAAIDLALNTFDYIEVFQFNMIKTGFWYDALSAGYRIPPAAGTDFPVNLGRWDPWPHLLSPLSAERMYVRVEGDFSFESWMEGFRNGRVLLTNGPMIDLKVNGAEPGEEVQISTAEHSVEITAAINHWRPMKEARFIVNGETIKVLKNDKRQSNWNIKLNLRLRESAWIAVYVLSDSTGDLEDDEILIQAHTAPVYVTVDNKPILVDSAVTRLIERARASRDYYASAKWRYLQGGMKEKLLERCDTALELYSDMINISQ